MTISERTINTALNQLADTYEHGPPVFCFHNLSQGDPDAGRECCVLGHLAFMFFGKASEYPIQFRATYGALGYKEAQEFYLKMDAVIGTSLWIHSQKETAVALRKYAQAYHPVPDKVVLLVVKPQALAA